MHDSRWKTLRHTLFALAKLGAHSTELRPVPGGIFFHKRRLRERLQPRLLQTPWQKHRD